MPNRKLLDTPINKLHLKIKGSHLEKLIDKLYHELNKKNIRLRPRCYLSDEWGCPHNVPIIGIPFYLANRRLCLLEKKMTGVAAETKREVLMYLRHETGHAFNYAYKLYQQREWKKIFGPFSRPYKEKYKPTPDDPHFVKHLPHWYAQKHPDEDFAESFAVWLTPGSNWKRIYARRPVLRKLLYIDSIVKRYAHQKPKVTDGKLDVPLNQLTMTLREWYRTSSKKKPKF